MTSIVSFLTNLSSSRPTELERALAYLWWLARHEGPESGRTAAQIADEFVAAGYSRPNVSRLQQALAVDRRTNQVRKGEFRLGPAALAELDTTYAGATGESPIELAGEFIPIELFSEARSYLKRVASQANGCHDAGFYDACAVMTRRLLETLVIDAYENAGLQGELKGPDGHYMMFSGLLGPIEARNSANMGRSTVNALKHFKRLGDLSAHNRRYNARRSDLVPLRADLRVAIEDLLHLSGQSR